MARAKSRKPRTRFFCKSCGGESSRWFGRCPACGEWNSLAEAPAEAARAPGRPRSGPRRAEPPRPLGEDTPSDPVRCRTGITELDRALGGGFVPGSISILGGDPGVGKSTLAMQAAASLVSEGRSCLYVSGEESRAQIALRAGRAAPGFQAVDLATANEVADIEAWASERRPSLLIVDSIQTTFDSSSEGAPGSVQQVRESGLRLHALAKATDTAVLLIGHVTKEGAVAGPRLLEHMVDAVLYLEAAEVASYRVLRGVKNRFGSTDEIGLFEMRDAGLVEVSDPSLIAAGSVDGSALGSVVACVIEGTRPILLEVQALVTGTAFGMPQRVANGVDNRRLAVLLAVLKKHAGVDASDHDVFVNVVAGLRIQEPAVDLAVMSAVVSSLFESPLPPRVALFGEVGLNGEVRRVNQPGRRVSEALRVGFERVILPEASVKDLERAQRGRVVGVASVLDALRDLGLSDGVRRVRASRGRTRYDAGRGEPARGGSVPRSFE